MVRLREVRAKAPQKQLGSNLRRCLKPSCGGQSRQRAFLPTRSYPQDGRVHIVFGLAVLMVQSVPAPRMRRSGAAHTPDMGRSCETHVPLARRSSTAHACAAPKPLVTCSATGSIGTVMHCDGQGILQATSSFRARSRTRSKSRRAQSANGRVQPPSAVRIAAVRARMPQRVTYLFDAPKRASHQAETAPPRSGHTPLTDPKSVNA